MKTKINSFLLKCLDLGRNGKENLSRDNLVIKLSSVTTYRHSNGKNSKFLGERFKDVGETNSVSLLYRT